MLPIPPFTKEPETKNNQWTKEEQELPGSCLNIGRDFEDEAVLASWSAAKQCLEGFSLLNIPSGNLTIAMEYPHF